MKGCNLFNLIMIPAVACAIMFSLVSCAKIPIKDGGLVIGKDTTASIEDIGVACVNSKF